MDPLTDNINALFRRGVDFEAGCDCGAPTYALHKESCSITPVYSWACFEMDTYPRAIMREFPLMRATVAWH